MVPGEWLFMADCTHSSSCPKAAARSPTWRLRVAAATLLDLGLLRNLECVIDLYPKVPYGALQFAMAKQELDGP